MGEKNIEEKLDILLFLKIIITKPSRSVSRTFRTLALKYSFIHFMRNIIVIFKLREISLSLSFQILILLHNYPFIRCAAYRNIPLLKTTLTAPLPGPFVLLAVP